MSQNEIHRAMRARINLWHSNRVGANVSQFGSMANTANTKKNIVGYFLTLCGIHLKRHKNIRDIIVSYLYELERNGFIKLKLQNERIVDLTPCV